MFDAPNKHLISFDFRCRFGNGHVVDIFHFQLFADNFLMPLAAYVPFVIFQFFVSEVESPSS